jgi:predicted cupin superfamily sugar epimerase
MDSKTIIDSLGLSIHPEGGYYKETYRASDTLNNLNGEARNISTAIYYMLEGNDRSHFHRIANDEMWFFHSGTALDIHCIVEGQLQTIRVGADVSKGEVLQTVIPAYTWFAAQIVDLSSYSLLSCVVAPGFDFKDFELANRAELILEYPNLKSIITDFTRS